jgi:serine protease
MRSNRLLLAFVVFSCLRMVASTFTVPGAATPTIQSAIDAASAGDIVLVSPGTYYENIDFLGKAIVVQSQSGAAVTTINGQQLGPVVQFHSGEGASSVLQGFTITNGKAVFASQWSGGGVYIANSSPSILNNIITGNSTCSAGGGIYANFGAPLIQGNTITNNSQVGCSGGSGGGGIAIGGSNGPAAQIIGNLIINNSHGSWGGRHQPQFCRGGVHCGKYDHRQPRQLRGRRHGDRQY